MPSLSCDMRFAFRTFGHSKCATPHRSDMQADQKQPNCLSTFLCDKLGRNRKRGTKMTRCEATHLTSPTSCGNEFFTFFEQNVGSPGAKSVNSWAEICVLLKTVTTMTRSESNPPYIAHQPALHCPPAVVMGSLLFLSKMLGRLGQKV